VLYGNVLLFIYNEENKSYWVDPFLNIYVFGISMDSIFTDVGMSIGSGMLRNLSLESIKGRLPVWCVPSKGHEITAASTGPAFQFNSRAYDEE
jgi:hypothetical protein